MSQFLASSEPLVHQEVLLGKTLRYVAVETASQLENYKKCVEELQKLGISDDYVKDDGVEIIGKFLANSNHRFRMYGSARELAENVKIYRNIQESSHVFDIHDNLLCSYNTTAVIYKNLKNEEYICKQDAYLILQNMTLEAYPFEKTPVFRMLIAMFLRTQELENLKNRQFVKFDQEGFDEIYEEIKEEMSQFMTDPSKFHSMLSKLKNIDFADLFEMFKDQIPSKWRENEVQFFQKELLKYVREFSDKPNCAYRLTALCTTIGDTVRVLRKVIDNRLEIFKNQGSRITVRLFEDGDERIVMKAELLEAICKLEKRKNTYEDEGMIIDTMDMKYVEKNYGYRIKNIEFIRTPIIRAKHKAVPIQIGETKSKFYCVLAVDALFNFMRSIFFGQKLYQKYKPSSTECKAFHLLEGGFDPNRTSKFFLTNNGASQLKTMFEMMYACYAQLPAKDVRNAKKDGFTVQNLKNELAHLNLTCAFPEIQDYAEVVYSEVEKRKKEPVLRTCDLFDAIEQCQLVCLFNRLPNILKFLHNQKGCHRIYALQCEMCEIEKASEDPTTTEDSGSSIQRMVEALKARNLKTTTTECKRVKKKACQAMLDAKKASESKTTTVDTQKASESKNPSLQKAPKVPTTTEDFGHPDGLIQKTSESMEPMASSSSEAMKTSESTNPKTTYPECKRAKKKACQAALDAKKASESKITPPNDEKPPELKNPTVLSSECKRVRKKACQALKSAQNFSILATDPQKLPESRKSELTTSEAIVDVEESKTTAPETQKASESKNVGTGTLEVASEAKNPKMATSESKKSAEKPPESQKTSANCEKCYRACEMLNETKKELKMSENKLKNVEKKMMGKEREVEEKEKEIQELKTRIREKEDENQILNDEISELRSSMRQEGEFQNQEKLGDEERRGFKAEIQKKNGEIRELKEKQIKMTAENEVSQRMIQQLLDKLALGSYSNPSSSQIPK